MDDQDVTCPQCGLRSLQMHEDSEGYLISCANCPYIDFIPKQAEPEDPCIYGDHDWLTHYEPDGSDWAECRRCGLIDA